MRELFKHTDTDGDITRLTWPHRSFDGERRWAIRLEVGEERRNATAYLDRAALERLSVAILAELGTAPAPAPVDPQAPTRRAQALVAASRTAAATVGSDAVIATAREFERYLSGETDAPPATEDAEESGAEDAIQCRECGHEHLPNTHTCGALVGTGRECRCRNNPCPDCGHRVHANVPCGIPQTTENGRPARCRCGLQDVPMEAVQEKCTDCGHAPHTGMACGRLQHPEKGDVMERCRCGLEETNARMRAAVAPAGCWECSHPHVQGQFCYVTVTTGSGRKVVCGCER